MTLQILKVKSHESICGFHKMPQFYIKVYFRADDDEFAWFNMLGKHIQCRVYESPEAHDEYMKNLMAETLEFVECEDHPGYSQLKRSPTADENYKKTFRTAYMEGPESIKHLKRAGNLYVFRAWTIKNLATEGALQEVRNLANGINNTPWMPECALRHYLEILDAMWS